MLNVSYWSILINWNVRVVALLVRWCEELKVSWCDQFILVVQMLIWWVWPWRGNAFILPKISQWRKILNLQLVAYCTGLRKTAREVTFFWGISNLHPGHSICYWINLQPRIGVHPGHHIIPKHIMYLYHMEQIGYPFRERLLQLFFYFF